MNKDWEQSSAEVLNTAKNTTIPCRPLYAVLGGSIRQSYFL
jgi:hypothetical protein